MIGRASAVLLASLAIATAGCGDGPDDGVLVAEAAEAAAIAPYGDGFVFGERATGVVRVVDGDGALQAAPLARVDVRADGQRGLLGLAVDSRDRVFAAWTDDSHLLVGQVAPGSVRVVWEGPETAERANGGHLVFGPDGRLVIGVGDLEDPSRVADPAAPNGKLLALEPDGPPDQVPGVINSGWNNPFAFTFGPDGALWVADNAPGDEPERLVRADRADAPVTELPASTAPSGITVGPDGELLVCGYVSGALLRYRVEDDRAVRAGTASGDCALAVVTLRDGRVVYATGDEIRLLRG